MLTLLTFGKYHKGHVCNLKEFKVFVGLTLDHMVEVLSSGLRNDEEPETFPVTHKIAQNVIIPCRFIKIVPMAAWGANFNFSIWFLKCIGVSDATFVEKGSIPSG